jgi:hypothetical protein
MTLLTPIIHTRRSTHIEGRWRSLLTRTALPLTRIWCARSSKLAGWWEASRGWELEVGREATRWRWEWHSIRKIRRWLSVGPRREGWERHALATRGRNHRRVLTWLLHTEGRRRHSCEKCQRYNGLSQALPYLESPEVEEGSQHQVPVDQELFDPPLHMKM